MSEIINTYMLSNPYEVLPINRTDFYKEQIAEYKKNGVPTRACEVINVFIFNSHGEVLIQKRSYNKNHNPGLLDKSIGGHVVFGDTADYTVMVETIQELQTPSIVLKNDIDFNKTFDLLGKYLETISVIRHGSTSLIVPKKIISGQEIVIANKVHIYFGVYDGRIRPVDREAKGILYYSFEELEDEMQKFPETFTDDLHFLVKEYRSDILSFIDKIKK